jgi:hypothetical protein
MEPVGDEVTGDSLNIVLPVVEDIIVETVIEEVYSLNRIELMEVMEEYSFVCLSDKSDENDEDNDDDDDKSDIDSVFANTTINEESRDTYSLFCNLSDEADDSKIDAMDLLKTYKQVYAENIEVKKLLAEALENLQQKNNVVQDMEKRIVILSEDGSFLRTENAKLKNELKVFKQKSLGSETEGCMFNMSESREETEFSKKTYKELNDLREELSEFRKYMYNEILIVKGCVNRSNVSSDTSSDASSDTSSDTSNAKRNSPHTQSSLIDQGINTTYMVTNTCLPDPANNSPRAATVDAERCPVVPGPRPYNKAHIQDTDINRQYSG